MKNEPTEPRRGLLAVENVRGHWFSMSVAVTVTVTGVSSRVESLAGEAVGGSLTQVIEMVAVAAVEVERPSLAVYWKEPSSGAHMLESGTKVTVAEAELGLVEMQGPGIREPSVPLTAAEVMAKERGQIPSVSVAVRVTVTWVSSAVGTVMLPAVGALLLPGQSSPTYMWAPVTVPVYTPKASAGCIGRPSPPVR